MGSSRGGLTLAIALLGALTLGADGSCGGGGGTGPGDPSSGGPASSGRPTPTGEPAPPGDASAPDASPSGPPPPAVAVAPTSLELVVPGECEARFSVQNTGPSGSALAYTVADDGALGGFLDVTNARGALGAGTRAELTTRVKPLFATADLKVSALVLNVYTPGASNFTKTPVGVRVRQRAELAQSLVGTWTGTWSGVSHGRAPTGKPAPTAPVSGQLVLTIASVDAVAEAATGSIVWTGADASWRYTYDTQGIATATPAPFVPDRTVAFDGRYAKLLAPVGGTGSGCPAQRFRFVYENKDVPNPSDAFYGPRLDVEFDAVAGTLTSFGVGFSTHPYDPENFDTAVSDGTVSARRGP